ncbi:MAG: Arm DNA-binding domain-containing protein, partial [Clostridia bacterium]|nr:Arm DNA-binding domain-containing protein [Clostridia bacterium]
MAVYKDKHGKWYVSVYFVDWKGERARKLKRGFGTKREAQEWERQFLNQSKEDLDMSFEAFVELYKRDLKERLKRSTWLMKT